MSEIITSDNLDKVISINREIKSEIKREVMQLKASPSFVKNSSMPQLAVMILQEYGLIQMPVEDKYWSGAIFVKEGKLIPVINTALSRANQFFTAWHEVYHLFYDKISFDHMIEADNILEERKAEYFAACMLLDGVERYFNDLSDKNFISKIFNCMAMFQAPYKAVLVSLYEYACQSDNEVLCAKIKEVFDLQFDDISEKFRDLGLDDNLVKPSYVINAVALKDKIADEKLMNPDLTIHQDNEKFLYNVISEVNLIVRRH